MTESSVAILGGGLSGVLTAIRLCQRSRDTKFILLEKEPVLGGYLVTDTPGLWAKGLNFISPKIFSFLVNSSSVLCQDEDLFGSAQKITNFECLVGGGKLASFAFPEIFSGELTKAIAGSVGLKNWRKLLSDEERSQNLSWSFAKSLKISTQDPALVVLAKLGSLLGVSDPAHTMKSSIFERLNFWSEGVIDAKFPEIFAELLKRLPNLDVKTSYQVLSAKFDSTWKIETSQGTVRAKTLIVTLNPWEALPLFELGTLPVSIQNYALKSKPDSIVILNVQCENPPNTALCLIPQEEAHVVIRPKGALLFHTVIDYEHSLEAANVTKAVKSLKRALAKFSQAHPTLKVQSQHISLLPFGWGQTCHGLDSKIAEDLQTGRINSDTLRFCGAAYGKCGNPDENILSSVGSIEVKLSEPCM